MFFMNDYDHITKPCIINIWILYVSLQSYFRKEMLLVNKIKTLFIRNQIFSDKYHYPLKCLSWIKRMTWVLATHRSYRAIWNKANEWVCQKTTTTTKNAIFFSLNRRCFPPIHSIILNKETPICFQLFTGMMIWCFFYIFYFHHNETKTSPVFRWTGRILGQNDSKEVNTCTSDDFDPEFCESRGYVLLSYQPSSSECSYDWFVV